MKQIADFPSRKLHNNEHSQLNSDILNEINNEPQLKAEIARVYAPYAAAVAAEAAAEEVEKGSKETKTIKDANDYREQMYSGFVSLNESNTNSFDAETTDMALNIERIIHQKGSIHTMNFNAKSDALNGLVSQLRKDYPQILLKLNETIWIDKLDEANQSFIDHFGSRANESAARISGDVHAARLVTDETGKATFNQINALALVNGEAKYAVLIDRINYYIDYNKNTLAARKGRKKPSSDAAPTI